MILWLALVRVIVKILSRNDLFLIIRGNMLLKSKETIHYFSKKQLGPYNDALK